MSSEKINFTNRMEKWLSEFLNKKLSKDYVIEVFIPISNLSKITKIKNGSFLEFKPDIVAILVSKKDGSQELAFMNRSTNAISLKEIGELHCYSKIAKPLYSFVVSPKGLPEEVNKLLLNEETMKSILTYEKGKHIITFKWDEEKDSIDKLSIIPFDEKKLLL